MWDWDPATDQVHVSARFCELAGLAKGSLSREEWLARIHPDDVGFVRTLLGEVHNGIRSRGEQVLRQRRPDGSWRWMVASASRSLDGTLIGGSLTDVTDERSVKERLDREVLTDVLTGLPRRQLFLDRLSQALERFDARGGLPVCVLFVDLDRFHKINDSLGNEAGDGVLVQLARRLESCLRLGDTLARLESDKFAFLFDGVRGQREVMRLSQSIESVLRAPVRIDDVEIHATAAIGAAISRSDADAESLLRESMAAMHRVKEGEGVGFAIFDPELNDRERDRLLLEANLYQALDRNELTLHYQPVVSFSTGELSSFEALLRWNHPERGMVSPARFVPIAEENGLITRIGEWVMNEACRQMKEWQEVIPESRDVSVAVNLSARQFEEPELVNQVGECLERQGLPSHSLKLEMTESVVMARTKENAAKLQSLRDLGIRLLIDDFGTGYSSLASLHLFPLDTLKIDRSFVSRMEFEEEKAEIVNTILSLAGTLGMDVVAEGVETAEQLTMLRDLGCHHGQGWYFSKAVDKQSAAEWLEAGPRW